jgi:hypothetical protein
VAEDARAAARRIVEEVLAQRGERPSGGSDGGDHDGDGTTTPGGATAATGSVAGDETPAPIPLTPPDALDPRGDVAALSGPVVADALDERPSRVTARRIVEEVLAEHAAAQREVEVPAPLAEGEGPPAPPERVPARAASGRAAVLPGPLIDEGVGVDADPGSVADDAASIARRIVESVLAEAAAREPEDEVVDGAVPPDGSDVATALAPDDGPPPHPVEAAAVEDDEGILHLGTAGGTAAASPDATSVSEAGGAADEDERDGTLALSADPTDAPDTTTPLSDDERPSSPDETVALPSAGSAADADESVASPSAGSAADADETLALPAAASDVDPDETLALPAAASDVDPDETVALPSADAADADGPPARPDAGRDVGGHDAVPPRAAEQPEGVGVATLPRAHASAEETTPMPITASKATRSHWLIASILGAIGLAVLLPLAVAALRSLVALS